jgi:hypothetical protein
MHRLTFPFAFLALAAGCTPDDGVASVTLDTVGADTAAAYCRAIFACPTAGDLAETRAIFGDEAACRAGYVRAIGAPLTDLVSLARAGSVRFDGAAARRCFDAIGASCELDAGEAACRGVFTGTAAVGASCFVSEQCAGDAWCDHGGSASTPATCPGTCRARLALGAGCTSSAQCTRVGVQESASCGGDGSGRCVDQRRTRAAAVGQACGTQSVAGNVATLADCQPGLVCVYPSAPTPDGPDGGTCRRPVADGAACDVGGAPCAGIGRCVPASAGAATGTCQSVTVLHTEGAACDDRRVCNPARRLACLGGTCRSTGTGGVGTPCTRDYGALICDPGFYCQGTGLVGEGTCQQQVAVGAACTSHAACTSGECSGSPAVCQAHVCH